MLDNPSTIPLDKQINIPYTLYTMNKQALTELLIDIKPNQIIKLGYFPDKEIAKTKKQEIERDIKRLKREGILIEDFCILIRREPAGYCILIYSLGVLKAQILELQDEELKTIKEVEL